MNNIILIGFMGAGKSTIGKELASCLEMEFVDTDELIESNEGMSIQELFDSKGEDKFRQLERDIILNGNWSNTVISVGGGMPCFLDNMAILKSKGITIYLNITAKSLSQRLWLKRKGRPLLYGFKTMSELAEFIDVKLAERQDFYKDSKIDYNADDKASCVIVEELKEVIKNLN